MEDLSIQTLPGTLELEVVDEKNLYEETTDNTIEQEVRVATDAEVISTEAKPTIDVILTLFEELKLSDNSTTTLASYNSYANIVSDKEYEDSSFSALDIPYKIYCAIGNFLKSVEDVLKPYDPFPDFLLIQGVAAQRGAAAPPPSSASTS